MTPPEQPKEDGDSIATRASLLGRLKNWDDASSWEDFTKTYWRLIYGVARQAGLSDEEARDVVQETLLGVAKNIHEFESSPERGSFKNWLLNITRWRVADCFRKRPPVGESRPPSSDAADRTATVERVAAPAELDAFWEAEWKKNIFETAVARICQRVKPKHAQIFDLYAVRHWPAAKVAGELGVSIIQVYLVNHRLTKLLKAEVAYIRKKLE
jgi:RNA polymerase sigma-70 factor (ECF subfamily)